MVRTVVEPRYSRALALWALVLLASEARSASGEHSRYPLDLLHLDRRWQATGAALQRSAAPGTALTITGHLRESARAWIALPRGLAGARCLVVEAKLAGETRAPIRLAAYVKDPDGVWYEHLHPVPLAPGKVTTVTVDLAEPRSLEPRQHFGEWDGTWLADVRELGLTVLAERPTDCTLAVRAVRIEGSDVPPPRLRIYDLTPPVRETKRFHPVEVSFRLNRVWENPFDPAQVTVWADVRRAGSPPVRVPGFLSQDFVGGDGASQRLLPFGAPRWTVRYTPDAVGQYRMTVTVAAGRDSVTTPTMAFTVAPSRRKGRLRVSRAVPYGFEHITGEWFQPIGHNLHSSVDRRGAWLAGIRRPVDRGVAAYEQRFSRMAKSGQNVTEIWLASWSFGLEWTARWPGFRGPGRYNLRHAAQLDRVLASAERHGVYVHLVIDNHGKASEEVDAEWRHHPYNRRNGGFLSHPQELFTHPRARVLAKRKLRYICARWGQSPHLLGITLWNEINLAGGRGAAARRQKAAWYRQMASHVKELAPRLLVGVHFSTDYRTVDPLLATLPEVDFVACDAYQKGQNVIELLDETAAALGRFGKPVLITEFGGDWYGGSAPRLKADLHAGLWSSAFLPLGGAPLFWWFDFIDKHRMDGAFAGLRRFLSGEDPLGRAWRSGRPTIRSDDGRLLSVGSLALIGPRSARVYLYDKEAAALWVDAKHLEPVPSAEIELADLEPGRYRVEVWNPEAGCNVQTRAARCVDGVLRFRVPAFRRDLAIKVAHQAGAGAVQDRGGTR